MSVLPNSLCQSCRNIVACGKPCHQNRGQHTPHALRKHVAPCGCRCTATGSCSEGALGHGIPFWACWWLPHNRVVRTCASASPMTSPRARAAPRARPRAARRRGSRSSRAQLDARARPGVRHCCCCCCCAAVQHNAHNLRTPKHEGLYRYGRRCGRHNLLLPRPLIGGMGGGAASPSRVNR